MDSTAERILQVVMQLQPGWTKEHAVRRVKSDLRAVRHARIHANMPAESFAAAYAKSYANTRPNLLPEPERLALEQEARTLLLEEPI